MITLNGTQVEDVPTDSILSLSITGDAAEVSINFADGDPIPVGGLYSDAAELELEGPHGSDPVMTTGTTAIVGSDQITYSPSTELVDNLNAAGGLIAVKGTAIVSLPFDGSTAQPVTVLPGAGVIVNGSTTVSALTIDPGGTLRMTGSGASLLTTGTLDLEAPDAAGDNGGILDLCDNDMIARQTPESVIDGLLASGFDDGLWDAAENGGIDSDATPAGGPLPAAITSSAAANDPTATHALGYQQVGSDSDQWSSATFDGVSVTDGDTVVKYTVYGDANLDGIVDSADQSLVESGYAGGLTGWSDGSFAYIGSTSAADETLLDGVGFTQLLDGGETAPATTADGFTPTGTVSGGELVPGSEADISGTNVTGTVQASTGATYIGNDGKPHDGAITFEFSRTDGVTAVGNSHWLQTITRTETDANGTQISGTYAANSISDIVNHRDPIKISRTLGVEYCDALTNLGWSANIRPAEGTEVGLDAPDDRTRIFETGGAASTTWVGHDYLVVNNVVVYEYSWTYSQFLLPGDGGLVSGYSEVEGQTATQLPGNPPTLTIGTMADGTPLQISNPAKV